jgi:hypothetical protein
MKTSHTHDRTGPTAPDGRPVRFIEPPPHPVHDLLVMSHGAGTLPAESTNHACLNSLVRSSWIMSSGG